MIVNANVAYSYPNEGHIEILYDTWIHTFDQI